MTTGSTQQLMCCKMMGREKCAAWNKHVHLQEQTENGWQLSLMWWFWIMQFVSMWLVGGDPIQYKGRVALLIADWQSSTTASRDLAGPHVRLERTASPKLSNVSCRVTRDKKQVTVKCDEQNIWDTQQYDKFDGLKIYQKWPVHLAWWNPSRQGPVVNLFWNLVKRYTWKIGSVSLWVGHAS